MKLAIFIPVYIRTGSALLDQSPDKDVFVWPRFGSVCSQCSHRQLVSHSLHPNWIQGYDPSCKTEQIFAFLYEKELVLEVVRVMSFVNTFGCSFGIILLFQYYICIEWKWSISEYIASIIVDWSKYFNKPALVHWDHINYQVNQYMIVPYVISPISDSIYGQKSFLGEPKYQLIP